jgi:hypothetical protein
MKLMIIFETILDSPQSNKYVMSLSPSVAQIDQVSDSNSLWVNKLYNNGNLLSLQTQNNNMFVVNSQGSLTMNGDIEVLGGNISLGSGGNIRYNETTKAIEFSNDKQTWVQLGALKSKTILSAEYPGAVFASDGNNNFGNMTAGSEGVVNNSMNYYQWSSSDISLNDYDIRVRFKIPEDFETWGEGYIRLNYVTQSNDVNFNKVDLYMFKQGSDIVDGFSENLVSKEGGKWSSIDIFGSQLKECVNPGDVCMFVIKMSSSNGNYTRVGDIEIEYNRNL